MSNKTKGLFMVVIASFLYGLGAVLAKLVTEMGVTVPTIVCIRGLLSAVLLFFYCKIKHVQLTVPNGYFKKIIMLSLFGATLTMILLNLAYVYLPVGTTTTIHYLYPIAVNIGGYLIVGHKPAKVSLLVLAVCTIGVFLMFESIPSNGRIGILFAMLSVFAWSFYMLYLDHSGIAARVIPEVVSYYASIVQVVVGLVMGFFAYGHSFEFVLPGLPFLFLAALASTVISTPLYQKGIVYIGAEDASILSILEPISSIIFGVILLREIISLRQVVASIIIFASILFLIVYDIRRNKKDTLGV